MREDNQCWSELGAGSGETRGEVSDREREGERRLQRVVRSLACLQLLVSSAFQFIAFARDPEITICKLMIKCLETLAL